MKNTYNYIALVSSLALASGCGSLSHKKDDQALSKIQKVALVAFMADEPASATFGLNLLSGKLGAEAGGSMLSQKSADVDEMYKELSQALGDGMKWKMMPLERMIASSGYVAAYKSTMEGIQNKMPPGSGTNRFVVEKVMDHDSMRILGREGRDKLIESLGVDAIVAAKVDTTLEGFSVMGVGSKYPKSNLSLVMYERGNDSPIWFEGMIEGEKSAQSVGSTGFTDEGATGRLALASARTAFKKIAQSQ